MKGNKRSWFIRSKSMKKRRRSTMVTRVIERFSLVVTYVIERFSVAMTCVFERFSLVVTRVIERFSLVVTRVIENFSVVVARAIDNLSLVLVCVIEKLLLNLGARNVQTRLVEPIVESMNSGDVFVLVTPKQVHQWNGKFCSIMEKARVGFIFSAFCSCYKFSRNSSKLITLKRVFSLWNVYTKFLVTFFIETSEIL